MLGELASGDKDFAPYYNPSFVFSGYGYELGFKLPMADVDGNPELCALLADRTRVLGAPALESVERIDERERAELPPIPSPPVAVLRRCAACHDGHTPAFVGIEIPFTNPVALRQKLRFEPSVTSASPLLNELLARISGRSRNPMPPESSGAPLSERDRRELAEYLSALAAQPR